MGKLPIYWLNPQDKMGHSTFRWREVLFDIKEGRITSLKQVTDVYKVSFATQKLIEKELKNVYGNE